MAPGHDCEQFHSQPDGTAGVNADGDLTRPPDYPTASQTCARLVPERLLLHATLTIRPASPPRVAICVATSRRPHPLYWNQARPVRLPLPIIPGVIATAHRFGGFGLMMPVHDAPREDWRQPETAKRGVPYWAHPATAQHDTSSWVPTLSLRPRTRYGGRQSCSRIDQRCRHLTFDRHVPKIERPWQRDTSG